MLSTLAIVVSLNVLVTEAYVSPVVRSSPFVSSSTSRPTIASLNVKPEGWISTDFEDNADMVSRLEKLLEDKETIDDEQAKSGMPWKSSIDPAVKLADGEDLLYMPFWEWQVDFMKEHLTNLEVVSCSNGDTDFGYNENLQKKARIVSVCARSAEYRKIRLTYYDAGDNTQVFNAVWYPDPKYNLPILGVDLLAFNRKKYLAIVDFQPLHDEEKDHAQTFEDLLAPIKEKYETLKGKMSSKFYDETKFFSQQMLFARFDDESVVQNELFPAFQQYAKTHLDMIRTTPANVDEMDYVLERQQAYDTYSAERDPATGFFTAMFGKQWATDFVHDFLFSMSERPSSDDGRESKTPSPPPQGQQQPPVSAKKEEEKPSSTISSKPKAFVSRS